MARSLFLLEIKLRKRDRFLPHLTDFFDKLIDVDNGGGCAIIRAGRLIPPQGGPCPPIPNVPPCSGRYMAVLF